MAIPDLNEYRFRGADSSGLLRLLETEVEVTTRSGFSRWAYRVPYVNICSRPVRFWQTTSAFWLCLLVGSLGISGSLSVLFRPDDSQLPVWLCLVVLVGSLVLLGYAWTIRREEWVIFLVNRSKRIAFCRTGPDSRRFDDFTDALIERMRAAKG